MEFSFNRCLFKSSFFFICISMHSKISIRLHRNVGLDPETTYFKSWSFILFSHFKAIREFRQRFKMQTTVIIGCTGNADHSATAMLDAGADNVWSKPMPHTREMIAGAYTLKQLSE